MKSYHFDFGDSNDGQIGFSARVTAESPEAAAALLREALPEAFAVPLNNCDSASEAAVEYVNVYINAALVTTADIFEEDDAQ